MCKKFYLTLYGIVFALLSLNAQTTIHCWDFNGAADFTSPLSTDHRVTGNGTITHNILNVENFVGSALNACAGSAAGGSFCPQPGPDMVNNGSNITMAFPTTGYENIEFTFWFRRTGTGFDNNQLWYSADGGLTFDSLASFSFGTAAAGNVFEFDFSEIEGANDNPDFQIRVILLNGSGATGNNRYDNITLSGTIVPTDVDDPLFFDAVTQSSSQIGLSVTPNAAEESVMIAWNNEPMFGTPESGISYTTGTELAGGGTILYTGTAPGVPDHTDLNSGTAYYYKAWSVSAANSYSVGIEAQASTAETAPYEFDFTVNPFNTGWMQYSVTGAQTWTYNAAFNNASMSAFSGGCQVNEDWLITPAFDLNTITSHLLTVDVQNGFLGDNDLELLYSVDYNGSGNPNNATWVSITTITNDYFSDNSIPSNTSVAFGPFSTLQGLSGSLVYVAFKFDFLAGECATWRVAGLSLSGSSALPALEVLPQSLSGFEYEEGSGPSEAQWFSVSGTDLFPVDGVIEIDAQETDFEVSLDNILWAESLQLLYTEGELEEVDVFVRLKAGLEAGLYSGQSITVSGGGVTGEILVSVSGEVTEVPGPEGLQLLATNQTYIIDFDNTFDGVHEGAISASVPAAAVNPALGQLDAAAWDYQIDGTSASVYNTPAVFPGTFPNSSGPNAGGSFATGINVVEIPAAQGGTGRAFGVQPTGGHWTAGSITLRIKNMTGSTLNTLGVTYDAYYFNDQPRSNELFFLFSENNDSYTRVFALDLTSPEPAYPTPIEWVHEPKGTLLTNLNIPDGDYIYLRWAGDDVSGSGARDEFAIDNIAITANPDAAEFYYKGTGDLTNLSNWGANPDGSGDAPVSFSAPNHNFHIVNTPSVALNNNLAVTGGGHVIVGNGIDSIVVTIAPTAVLTAEVNVTNLATLELENEPFPVLNSIADSSTVVFRNLGDFVLPVPPSYGNLVVDNSSVVNPGFNHLQLNGNIQLINNANFIANEIVIRAVGSGDQIIAGNGGVFTIRSLDRNFDAEKPSGKLILAPNTPITLNWHIQMDNEGEANRFEDGGNTIVVHRNASLHGNADGYLLTGTLRFVGDNVNSNLRGANNNWSPAAEINHLVIAKSDSASISFRGSSVQTIVIKGNLTIEGADGSGDIVFHDSKIRIGGNFVYERPQNNIIPGASIVAFNGSTEQSFTASTPDLEFFGLKVNKPDGDLILNAPLYVTTHLELLSGNVQTGDGEELRLRAEGLVMDAGPGSFVDGPMMIEVNGDLVDLLFPVGRDNAYRAVYLIYDQDSAQLTWYRAEVTNEEPPLFPLDSTLAEISSVRYWQIDQTPEIGLSNGYLGLVYGADDNVSDPNVLRMARLENDVWTNYGGIANSAPDGILYNFFPMDGLGTFTLAWLLVFDCPDLALNNGDTCLAEGMEGIVIDCNCEVLDCAGVPGGEAFVDNCGECVGGTTELEACEADCAGVFGGTSEVDECGVCLEDGPLNPAWNATCTDCAGVVNGEAFVDNCGECVGGTTELEACEADCAGVFGGTSEVDECGVCLEDGPLNPAWNATCTDCAGVVNGTAEIDPCGNCIQDGENNPLWGLACIDTTFVVSGLILTENGDPIANAEVFVNGLVQLTGPDGAYAMEIDATDEGMITAAKDINVLNGITTFDVVLMQQHVLGTQILGSPYAKIAADINANGVIEVGDILQLRRMIILLDSDFIDPFTGEKNNTSWRFALPGLTDPNPASSIVPEYQQGYDLADIGSSSGNLNLIGVKIGDVNQTASGQQFAGPEQGHWRNSWTLQTGNVYLKAGETYQLNWYAPESDEPLGFQMAMNLENIILTGISSAVLKTWDENAYNVISSNGSEQVLISWSSPEAVTDHNRALLTMTLRANTSGYLSDMIRLDYNLLYPEVYIRGADHATINLAFVDKGGINTGVDAESYPNPFSRYTNLRFYSPVEGTAKVIIYNIAGQPVYTHQMAVHEGLHNLIWTPDQDMSAGAYFYRIETPETQYRGTLNFVK